MSHAVVPDVAWLFAKPLTFVTPSPPQTEPSMRIVLEVRLVHSDKRDLYQQNSSCGVRSYSMDLERSWEVTDEREHSKAAGKERVTKISQRNALMSTIKARLSRRQQC